MLTRLQLRWRVVGHGYPGDRCPWRGLSYVYICVKYLIFRPDFFGISHLRDGGSGGERILEIRQFNALKNTVDNLIVRINTKDTMAKDGSTTADVTKDQIQNIQSEIKYLRSRLGESESESSTLRSELVGVQEEVESVVHRQERLERVVQNMEAGEDSENDQGLENRRVKRRAKDKVIGFP